MYQTNMVEAVLFKPGFGVCDGEFREFLNNDLKAFLS